MNAKLTSYEKAGIEARLQVAKAFGLSNPMNTEKEIQEMNAEDEARQKSLLALSAAERKPVTGEGKAPCTDNQTPPLIEITGGTVGKDATYRLSEDTVKYVETEAQFQAEASKLLTSENLDNVAPARDEPFLPTPSCPSCGRPPEPVTGDRIPGRETEQGRRDRIDNARLVGWSLADFDKGEPANMNTKTSQQYNEADAKFFAEAFTDPITEQPLNVPENLKRLSTRLCRSYGINGICDPMYIANVIAVELGLGDGYSNFNPQA